MPCPYRFFMNYIWPVVLIIIALWGSLKTKQYFFQHRKSPHQTTTHEKQASGGGGPDNARRNTNRQEKPAARVDTGNKERAQ